MVKCADGLYSFSKSGLAWSVWEEGVTGTTRPDGSSLSDWFRMMTEWLQMKKIFTLFSFLSIRRAIRDWFVHDWEIEEFVWILNRRETNGKQTTVNFNFHFKSYSQKMTLDVMNVLMMSGSWSYGGVSSFFLHGTHLKVNLHEGLLGSEWSFCFWSNSKFEGWRFSTPWSIKWISAL